MTQFVQNIQAFGKKILIVYRSYIKNHYISLITILIIVIIFFSNYFDKKQLYFDINGNWKGNVKYYELSVMFNNAGNCNLELIDTKMEKEVFNYKGDYKINYQKNPITLSIRNIVGLNYPLHAIIKIIDKNKIIITKFSNRWRLRNINFSEDHIFKLNRTENKIQKEI